MAQCTRLGSSRVPLEGCWTGDAGSAIHAAASGDALISPSVTAQLIETFTDKHVNRPPQPIEPLTDREEEVLIEVAGGLTNAEIADEPYISRNTVKSHLASLMLNLSARNRVEIAISRRAASAEARHSRLRHGHDW